jgi:hypothetical protein
MLVARRDNSPRLSFVAEQLFGCNGVYPAQPFAARQKGQDPMDEVNLNDPLTWYISDAMDQYIGGVDSEAAKKVVERNRAYSKLLQAVKDAADHLEATGDKDRAAALRQQIAELEHLA